MELETRTRWIPISELTTEHDIAGFGPVETIVCNGNLVRVSNPHGVSKEYNTQTQVELYEGVFDASGRRISMSTEEYKASIHAERAGR